jgi:hypothetical protein
MSSGLLLRGTSGVSDDVRRTPAPDDEQARRPRLSFRTKAALCGASTMLTAHPAGRHAITGPPRDSRNNPCRRQGDQVVAPGSTGRRLLVEDVIGATGTTPISSSPIAWRPASAPVVLSQGAHARMDVPVGRVRWATLRTIKRRSSPGAGLRARFRPRCGRWHAPGRRARVSSATGAPRTWTRALASGEKRIFTASRTKPCLCVGGGAEAWRLRGLATVRLPGRTYGAGRSLACVAAHG